MRLIDRGPGDFGVLTVSTEDAGEWAKKLNRTFGMVCFLSLRSSKLAVTANF